MSTSSLRQYPLQSLSHYGQCLHPVSLSLRSVSSSGPYHPWLTSPSGIFPSFQHPPSGQYPPLVFIALRSVSHLFSVNLRSVSPSGHCRPQVNVASGQCRPPASFQLQSVCKKMFVCLLCSDHRYQRRRSSLMCVCVLSCFLHTV